MYISILGGYVTWVPYNEAKGSHETALTRNPREMPNLSHRKSVVLISPANFSVLIFYKSWDF